MSGLEERERAVELYFTTPMTTAQVVEHLGYPTRQCLERWLAMDSRYAGHMAKPIIPLETRRRAVELVLGGMQQKQAAKQLGVSVGAVHGWVRAYRKGGMAALQPKNRNSAQGNKPADSRRRPSAADDDDAEALRRRVEELEPGERVDAGGGGGSQKKTQAPTCLCSISCCGFSHDDFSGLGRACRPRNGLNWMVLVSPPERTGKDYDQHAPSTVYPSFAAERGIRRVDRAENTCQRADGA